MFKTILLTAAIAGAAGMAEAATWRFDFAGVLGSADSFVSAGQRAALPDATPFQLSAIFDDTLDLTAPSGLPGWAAYAPTTATMTLLGETYDVLSNALDPDDGIVVMLFDPTNVFNSDFWAAGIHGAPLIADTGIIARFKSTTPALGLDDGLEGTVYGDYVGAGYVSGPPDTAGAGNRCWPIIATATCKVQPLILFDAAGDRFELAIGSRALDGLSGGVGFSASLTPVPLPGALPLLAAAMAAPVLLGGLRRKSRRG